MNYYTHIKTTFSSIKTLKAQALKLGRARYKPFLVSVTLNQFFSLSETEFSFVSKGISNYHKGFQCRLTGIKLGASHQPALSREAIVVTQWCTSLTSSSQHFLVVLIQYPSTTAELSVNWSGHQTTAWQRTWQNRCQELRSRHPEEKTDKATGKEKALNSQPDSAGPQNAWTHIPRKQSRQEWWQQRVIQNFDQTLSSRRELKITQRLGPTPRIWG